MSLTAFNLQRRKAAASPATPAPAAPVAEPATQDEKAAPATKRGKRKE